MRRRLGGEIHIYKIQYILSSYVHFRPAPDTQHSRDLTHKHFRNLTNSRAPYAQTGAAHKMPEASLFNPTQEHLQNERDKVLTLGLSYSLNKY